jgi:hypothetical protein
MGTRLFKCTVILVKSKDRAFSVLHVYNEVMIVRPKLKF